RCGRRSSRRVRRASPAFDPSLTDLGDSHRAGRDGTIKAGGFSGMAAKAGSLSPERIAWWDRFQNLAELRIAESNVLSGECLWRIVKSQDGGVLLIQSTRHPGDFLECSADLQAAVLCCRPAPALEAAGLVFRVQQD